jgi:hypothetical protein
MNCCFSELTLKKTNKHGGLDKTKIFSSQSHMVGWTKQRFSHHKVTWWARQNKDFLITK